MVKLIFSPSGAAPIAHELSGELITIGRTPENTIHLDDPSVSGRHAQLHQAGETFHLQDLASTNGTRVNGEPITSVALKVGDRIRFGKVEARFESESGTSAQPLPVLAGAEAKPADLSARPADFANASPFPRHQAQSDSVRTGIYTAVAVALLAFLASMLGLVQMQPPAL